MRFMMLIKSDAQTEAGELPGADLINAMMKYNEDLVNAGVLLAGDGLHPSSKGLRLSVRDGEFEVKQGPFPHPEEIVAGYWLIQVKSKQEAIQWASRVPVEANGHGRGEIEVRQVYELADFPVEPEESGWREREDELRKELESRPAAASDDRAKTQYMMWVKADAYSEAGTPPTQEGLTEMGALMEEIASTGQLVAGEGLQPTSKGARVVFENGKRTVIDGPFTEAKELVAGYCIVHSDSLEQVVDWSKRMMVIDAKLRGGASATEIRRVFGPADFPAELVAEAPEAFAKEKELRQRTGR
jgi:hypothetical protein